jgi:hypothetical protein
MVTRSESVAPDFVRFWDAQADLPLEPYCAEPLCCPSAPCDACVLHRELYCETCGVGLSSVVLRPPGAPPVAVCVACKEAP